MNDGNKESEAGDNPASVPHCTGVVKWFNNVKGYGFIARDDGQGDIFVHFRGIAGTGYRSLTEGDKVSFAVEEGAKGLQAVAVSKQ